MPNKPSLLVLQSKNLSFPKKFVTFPQWKQFISIQKCVNTPVLNMIWSLYCNNSSLYSFKLLKPYTKSHILFPQLCAIFKKTFFSPFNNIGLINKGEKKIVKTFLIFIKMWLGTDVWSCHRVIRNLCKQFKWFSEWK